MKKSFVLLIIFMIASPMLAQPFRLGVGMGWASYNMHKLKELNEALLKSFPVEAKITDSFPPWLMYSLQSSYSKNPRVKMGLQYSFNSSGSRISSTDYSGEIHLDQIINGHSLGAGFWYGLFQEKKLSVNLGIEAGATYSLHKIREITIIQDAGKYVETTKFHSIGFFAMPEMEFIYHKTPFHIGLIIGPSINFDGDLIYGRKQGKLVNPNTRENVQADWTGVRIVLSLWYTLKKKNRDSGGAILGTY
nr:hypothetical protein [Bacteroidota bacterium]